MKKFIIAALAASAIATPSLAEPFSHYGTPSYRSPGGYHQFVSHQDWRSHGRDRTWRKGQRFDRRYARNYREIRNPRAYRLREAPRGYRWVQSGDDAVLIAIAGGVIGAVLANIFD